VLISLGAREGGTTRLQEAIAVLREVMTVIDAKQPDRLLHDARDRLAEAECLLACSGRMLIAFVLMVAISVRLGMSIGVSRITLSAHLQRRDRSPLKADIMARWHG
jgi:hypothetical protein